MNRLIQSITLMTIVIFALSFQSCSGSKVTEEDLKGTWILKSINQEAVADAFKGNKPTLEFDFEKNSILGNSGCNRFNGPFSFEGGVFKAGNLATTRMLCLEANKEAEFLSALATAEGLKLVIDNQVLSFQKGDNAILQFEKDNNVEK